MDDLDDPHLAKFWPLETMSDRQFGTTCASILAESLKQHIVAWLPVLNVSPLIESFVDKYTDHFCIYIDLASALQILPRQLERDLRLVDKISMAAQGWFFSLSSKRQAKEIDNLEILEVLDRLARSESDELHIRVLRLNLSTPRDRLRMATRHLDHYIRSATSDAASSVAGRFRVAQTSLLDLSEADQRYREQLSALETLAKSLTTLSRNAGGRPSETSRILWSSVLFTRLCNSLFSILKLLPGSSYSSLLADRHWDSSAVGTLTRATIECFLLHFYLCVDEISDEEWSARQTLMFLHDCTMRLRLFHSSSEPTEGKEFYESEQKRLIASLSANPYFQTLTPKQQARMLKGRDLLFLSQDEILSRIDGFDPAEFRRFYEHLSAHAHSLPVSFYRILDDDRGRGVENDPDKDFISMCLIILIPIMTVAQEHFCMLFPDLQDSSDDVPSAEGY